LQQVITQALVDVCGAQIIVTDLERGRRLSSERYRPPELSRVARRVRGFEKQVDPIYSGHAGRVRHLLPQLDRLGEVPKGFGRSGHCHGVGCRPDQGTERPWEIVACQAMVGEFRSRTRLGQEPCIGGVKAAPFSGEEVGIYGLLQKRMMKPVGLGYRVGHQDLSGDGLPKAQFELVLRTIGGRDQ
jgi:hypothetical protein